MSEKRLLAIIALLLILVSSLLIIVRASSSLIDAPPGKSNDFLGWAFENILVVVLSLAALLGGVVIYGGGYRTGGILALVIGIILIVLKGSLESVLIILGGALGVIAGEDR